MINQWENEYRTIGKDDRVGSEKELVAMYNDAVRELHRLSHKYEKCNKQLFDLTYKQEEKEKLKVKLVEGISNVNFERKVNKFLETEANKIERTEYAVSKMGNSVHYSLLIYYKE